MFNEYYNQNTITESFSNCFLAYSVHSYVAEDVRMRNVIFDDNRISIRSIEKSLDAYSTRQKAISNNIANAATPGYKAQKVNFEDKYKKYLDQDKNLQMKITNNKHIPLDNLELEKIKPRVTLRESTLNDSGINNVDIEKEMSELAQNNLRYELNVSLVRKRFQDLTSSIKGR